jgi:hypothetical protein
MALRTLQAVVATNYSKLSTDPILAGDIVASNNGSTFAAGVNPAPVARAARYNGSGTSASVPPVVSYRAQILGVAADDALGTNPSGETPTMINNDPAGSNFVNGSTFQSYTAGFYVGAKRAIADFKDESIDVVTNLTAGIPTYSSRGMTVYSTPSTQFVTDRFALVTAASGTVDTAGWTGVVSGNTSPTPGDLLTVGGNQNSSSATATANGNYPSAPTATSAAANTNNAGLLISAGQLSSGFINGAAVATAIPVVGRVDFYDSGAGLLYWTLL